MGLTPFEETSLTLSFYGARLTTLRVGIFVTEKPQQSSLSFHRFSTSDAAKILRIRSAEHLEFVAWSLVVFHDGTAAFIKRMGLAMFLQLDELITNLFSLFLTDSVMGFIGAFSPDDFHLRLKR